jgi:DNA-binding winged helix-turn-helix (wHTH) protein
MIQAQHYKSAYGASRRSRRPPPMNLLLVGSESAFKSDAAERLLDGLHLHVIARASTLSEAFSCLESGTIDLFLLSSEFREEKLSLFARDVRCHGFSGLILRSADTPEGVSAVDSSTIRSGDFVIDLSSHQFWIRGVETPCTRKEFELLKFLCRHPGELLSRETLLGVLWRNSAASPHNLRVLIRAVRAKIETTIPPRYIVTQRGLGYRFIPSPQSLQ